MKYIVEVREPVPSNLDEIAAKVAASFHISDDKALSLLRRAPGAVTRAVSEREADVVAGIFERAGLNVVKRPAEEAPPAPPSEPDAAEPPVGEPGAGEPGAGEPGAGEYGAGEPGVYEPGAGEAMAGESAYDESAYDEPAYDEPGSEAAAHEDDVWNRPLDAGTEEPVDAFSRRDGLAEGTDLGWGAADDAAASDGDRFEAGDGFDEGANLDGVELGGADLGDEPVSDMSADMSAETVADLGGRADGDDVIELEDDVGAEMPGALDAEAEGAAADSPGSRARQRWADEGGALGPEMGAAASAAAAAGAGDAAVGRPSQTPETMRSSRTPETVRRSQTPETVRSTLTRTPATLERGGLRRRVALSSILPALLTLVVMGVAMLVTTIPLLRAQQAARAADAAHAEASTLEALTGGMPLDSQTLQTALVDLARRSEAVLGGGGVRLMVVTDATGAPLAGWYGPATTPAAMPPDVRQQVSGKALSAVAGQVQSSEGLAKSLQATLKTTFAMLGLGVAGDVYGSAPVMSAGHAIGAVVVGVQPVSASALVGNAFLTTLLVGLVPLLIAILVALALTRGLRSQVSYLLGAADRISRGDLEEPVGLDSNDELGQLARAIERMRVSLQEGMERLRNRR